MKMRFLLLAITASLLAGCTTTAVTPAAPPAVTVNKPTSPIAVEVTRDRLVGWWYGDQPTKEGGRVQWLMRRAGDGSFRVTFRTTNALGQVDENTEVGEWGVSGNYLVTQTKGWLHQGVIRYAPSGDSYYWDVYELLTATADTLRYRAVESRNEYQVKRVPIGFTFPP